MVTVTVTVNVQQDLSVVTTIVPGVIMMIVVWRQNKVVSGMIIIISLLFYVSIKKLERLYYSNCRTAFFIQWFWQ